MGGKPSGPGRTSLRGTAMRALRVIVQDRRTARVQRRFHQSLGPDHLIARLSRNEVTANALRVAATLGIADLVEAGTSTADDLAGATHADRDALARVMAHLVAHGVFAGDPSSGYALNPVSRRLRATDPSRWHDILDLEGSTPRIERAVAGMLHSVRTGQPSYDEVFGLPFWADMADRPAMARSFDVVMERHAAPIGRALLERYPWDGVASVADIGGGAGELLRTLLDGRPGLSGTLVESGGALARAEAKLGASEVADRCRIVEGSFFDELPAGHDRYVLSWILHDWRDAEAEAILRRCGAALRAGDRPGAGARLLIIEKLQDRRPDTELDLRMLVLFGSRERTLAEYDTLLAAAGLTRSAVIDLGTGFFAVEVGPSSPGPS